MLDESGSSFRLFKLKNRICNQIREICRQGGHCAHIHSQRPRSLVPFRCEQLFWEDGAENARLLKRNLSRELEGIKVQHIDAGSSGFPTSQGSQLTLRYDRCWHGRIWTGIL